MKAKRFLAFALAAVTLTGAACSKTPEGGGNAEAEFWSTYATEKILADHAAENYADIRKDAVIQLEAAKNEDEGAQIIITAITDIGSYDVVLSDLYAGEHKYAKENVLVYNQKYIELNEITNGQSAVLPTGDWPDALLPFETAKAAGENNVEAGRNQGIYFEFHIPAETAAGVYSGTFAVEYDGKTQEIPVRLNVRDVEVSETTHSRSYFSPNGWGLAFGEMDSSLDTINRYNLALSKYRLGGGQWRVGNGSDAIAYFGLDENDAEEWVDLVWDYVKNPRNSTLAVPYRYIEDETGPNIDRQVSVDVLTAFAARCLEENVNLVAKLLGYYTMIDEPDMYGSADHVDAVMGRVRAAEEEAARNIEGMAGDAELKAEIAASLRSIVTVVPVASYNEKMAGSIDTWCPQIQNYDSEEERQKFQNTDEKEKWWYTCFGPSYPFASYTIDAAGTFPRILDWQAEKFGITGNLYWAVTYYQNENGTYVEDYYQSPTRTCDINGEGFLFYPGKPYGLDEPVGTLRLQSARDGIEDKELLLALREGYAAMGEAAGYDISAEAILDSLYEQLFDEMRILTNSERFFRIRSQMLDLAELFAGEEKFAVADVTRSGNDVEFEIALSAESNLKRGGETLSPEATYGEGENRIRIYRVRGSKLESDSVDLVVSSAKGEKNVSLPLGGVSTETYASDWAENATVLYGDISVQGDGADSLAYVAFDAADAGTTQRLVISGDFLESIGEDTDWVSFVLKKGEEDETLQYSICFEFERSAYYYEIASGTIRSAAAETITVRNIYGLPWGSGKVKNIHIYFGAQGDGARTAALGTVTVAALG